MLVKNILEEFSNINNSFFLIVTNGTLINDGHINTFHKAQNMFPIISVEGDACMTDLRRGKDTSKKIDFVMKKLKKSRIPFGFSCMTSHENVKKVIQRKYSSI